MGQPGALVLVLNTCAEGAARVFGNGRVGFPQVNALLEYQNPTLLVLAAGAKRDAGSRHATEQEHEFRGSHHSIRLTGFLVMGQPGPRFTLLHYRVTQSVDSSAKKRGGKTRAAPQDL